MNSVLEDIKAIKKEADALQENAKKKFNKEFVGNINREGLSPLVCEVLDLAKEMKYVKMSDNEGSEAYYTVITLDTKEGEVILSILTDTYTEDWTEFHSFDDTHFELFANTSFSELFDFLEENGRPIKENGYGEEEMELLWGEFNQIFEKARLDYGDTFLFVREEI